MLLRAIVLCLFWPIVGLAQDLPAPASDTISDFADLLSSEAEAGLTAELKQIRAETGVQMVVVTMDRLSSFGGADQRIEDYAKTLFNAWGIGDATRNDGILILVVDRDRVTRIALGSAYDAVYDGRAQRVIDTAMLPLFRESRMGPGIVAGVASARDRLITPFVAKTPVSVNDGFPSRFGLGSVLGLAGLAGVGGLILAGRRAQIARKTCPKCKTPSLTRNNELLQAATSTVSGNGITHLSCTSCGYSDNQPYAIAPQSGRSRRFGGRGGGGGAGGFGGGRSSGGGATGRW